MFGFGDDYEDVYGGRKHHSSLTHEAIAGAASFAAMREYENRQGSGGHKLTKELFAALAGAEADKLFETKGLDHLDRARAKRHAEENANRIYDEKYGNDNYGGNSGYQGGGGYGGNSGYQGGGGYGGNSGYQGGGGYGGNDGYRENAGGFGGGGGGGYGGNGGYGGGDGYGGERRFEGRGDGGFGGGGYGAPQYPPQGGYGRPDFPPPNSGGYGGY
ncbi:hypothetical protein BGZ46_008971 [Entomortierella lignicola]|nr:hypothetical protein BGZ46_008971 [Entomortierella lignicola]